MDIGMVPDHSRSAMRVHTDAFEEVPRPIDRIRELFVQIYGSHFKRKRYIRYCVEQIVNR